MDKEAPVGDPPRVTDHCQCCGHHRSSFDTSHLGNCDPLVLIEARVDLMGASEIRGTLCLCLWCSSAVYRHFVNPFIEKYHEPLQKKLTAIEAALRGQGVPPTRDEPCEPT